jgi:hypothetical protein
LLASSTFKDGKDWPVYGDSSHALFCLDVDETLSGQLSPAALAFWSAIEAGCLGGAAAAKMAAAAAAAAA